MHPQERDAVQGKQELAGQQMAVEFCTELADTVFQVTAFFEDTKRFCGDYLSQKAPQYVITVTERDIDFERQRANRNHQKEELPPVVYSDC